MKNPLKAWFANDDEKRTVTNKWKKLSSKEQSYLDNAWALRQEALDTDMPFDEHNQRYQEIVANSGLTERERTNLYDIWIQGRPELRSDNQGGKERK